MDSSQMRPEDFEAPTQAGVEMVSFKYRTPTLQRRKGLVPLCKSDILMSAVQVIQRGGENNLHSHASMDGFWFVLRGRARFYSSETEVFSEVSPFEGVFVPRGTKYWFESVGDDVLELLQVEAFAKGVDSKRTDHAPKRAAQKDFEVFDAVAEATADK